MIDFRITALCKQSKQRLSKHYSHGFSSTYVNVNQNIWILYLRIISVREHFSYSSTIQYSLWALCGYAWASIHIYQSQGQSKQRLSKLVVFILSTEVLCASKYLNTLSHKTRPRDLLYLSKKRNSPEFGMQRLALFYVSPLYVYLVHASIFL